MMKDVAKESEFRRHLIQANFEMVNLIFWIERGVDPKKRILDDTTGPAFINECFATIKQVLSEGEQSKYVIYNCFEMLVVCIERVRFHLRVEHIKAIIEMIVNEVTRSTNSHLCYVLRDVFGYFFEKMLYFVPKPMVLEVFDQVTDRLMNFKHKLSSKDDILYTLITKKQPEGMGDVPKLLTEIYLKTWYRVIKIFGNEVQERIQDVIEFKVSMMPLSVC
jgi:hypothetical protein